MTFKKLGLVHTSATLVPVFQKLCAENLQGIEVFNIVDDSLIKDVIAQGELTPQIAKRVVGIVFLAAQAGADYILVTCSSIGVAVETAATLIGVPVLRVDQPMADLGIQTGKKIGVVATLSTTLEPTSDLVKRRAIALGKEVEITSKLCYGAFEALMSGDSASHDTIVSKAIKSLALEVDVILLAQASMARVVDNLAEEDKVVPIISSPPEAIKYLANQVNG
ncbi:aspartate/glutamate racemase family protein [Belliella sp. DSM 111904]|uniref:Aspartate/glutamate racemase family protein n=1 Tax=Belliella filtrata TaxID=2923435 RepID=A0ABS9UVB5_9BACT|nr:aspartate/glutamate racemase family protein [Belliella filtrata]MCH7408106.1 aspartate/glutamate racemase family protein [Belliella filtrata]